MVSLLGNPVLAEQATEFKLLSYNIHGVPALITRDKPKARIRLIAERLDSFTVVTFQEDFVYHKDLTGRVSDSTTIARGNGARLTFRQLAFIPLLPAALVCWPLPHCQFPVGSGLTTLVKPSLEVDFLGAQPYEECHGYYAAANDCMGTKGWMGVRVQFAGGSSVDIYTTHLDAAYSIRDRDVRSSQLLEFAAAIRRLSAGRSVIVTGDLNSRRKDPLDHAPVAAFSTMLCLVEVPLKLQAVVGRFRELDYILFRSGKGADIRIEGAKESATFFENGKPLSDHPALEADVYLSTRSEPSRCG